MDFQRAIALYHSYGGSRLLAQYARMGLIWPIVTCFLKNCFNNRVYSKVYSTVLNRIEPFLRERYRPIMLERHHCYANQEYDNNRSDIVWFCWLQGLNNAPQLVTVCYNSLLRHLQDRKIVLIDETNWNDYIELPPFIVERRKSGHLPAALFSDMLRLELLIKYGGTWIDATVLCTGLENTKVFLDANMFMFQYTRPGSNHWGGISNWFITSRSNNQVLMVLRDMLFAYWKDFNCTLDYYIFHLFFSMLREVYPLEIASMPYGYSVRSLALMHHIGDKFEQEKWDNLISQVSFHKLPYRVSNSVKNDKENYFNYILQTDI